MTNGERRPAGPLGAATADHLADLVQGPVRRGSVVAVRTHAALAVVDVGDDTRMLSLAPGPAGATLTANTIVLVGTERPAAGSVLAIGEGAVVVDGRRHPVRRYWRSGVSPIRIDPTAAERVDTLSAGADDGLDGVVAEPVFDAIRSASGVRLGAAARTLVGLGPGSTPAGDDVLAGIAVALRITGHLRLLDGLAAALLPDLRDRTTALSADLLRAAFAGHVSIEVRALVLTLRPGTSTAALARSVAAVLDLGHTSGADLVRGLTGALRAVAPTPMLPAQSRRMADR